MAAFRRGKAGIHWIYVHLNPGKQQISTGTTDAKLAESIERMCRTLADNKRWPLLRALVEKPRRFTIDQLHEAYQNNQLDTLLQQLTAVRLDAHLGVESDASQRPTGWIADIQERAPASWRDAVAHVRVLLAEVTFAHELKPGKIRNLLNKGRQSGGTKRHRLYAWSSFCKYLVSQEVLEMNPCSDSDLVPRPKKAKSRDEWRTADVDQAIIERLSGDAFITALVCASTSADRSTVRLMKVRDFHLLPEGKAPNKDEGIEHRVDIPGTKTASRRRKGVRVEPWAVPMLRAWLKGKTPQAPIVGNLGLRSISMQWAKAAKAEGQEGYWLRDTRHSYACRALLDGYPLWEVSPWIGHDDQATTAKIYARMDYEVARRIRDGQRRSDKATSTTPSTTQPAPLGLVKEA